MKNDFAILRFSKIRNCGVDPLVEMGCPTPIQYAPLAILENHDLPSPFFLTSFLPPFLLGHLPPPFPSPPPQTPSASPPSKNPSPTNRRGLRLSSTNSLINPPASATLHPPHPDIHPSSTPYHISVRSRKNLRLRSTFPLANILNLTASAPHRNCHATLWDPHGPRPGICT